MALGLSHPKSELLDHGGTFKEICAQVFRVHVYNVCDDYVIIRLHNILLGFVANNISEIAKFMTCEAIKGHCHYAYRSRLLWCGANE